MCSGRVECGDRSVSSDGWGRTERHEIGVRLGLG